MLEAVNKESHQRFFLFLVYFLSSSSSKISNRYFIDVDCTYLGVIHGVSVRQHKRTQS